MSSKNINYKNKYYKYKTKYFSIKKYIGGSSETSINQTNSDNTITINLNITNSRKILHI